MTLREFFLRRDGYERLTIERWRQIRWLGYKMLEPHLDGRARLSLADILPLPGDPTAEEIEQRSRELAKPVIDKAAELIERYKQMGIIK